MVCWFPLLNGDYFIMVTNNLGNYFCLNQIVWETNPMTSATHVVPGVLFLKV